MKQDIFNFVKKHSSAIFCLIASVGVAATAVLAVKETPKAVRLIDSAKKDSDEVTTLEKIRIAAPVYSPALITGMITVACIFTANALNKKQQTSIAGAYTLINSSYKAYKNKVKELYGEEAHKKILDSIAVEQANNEPSYAQCLCGEYSLGVEDANEKLALFYEPYSQRYFESTIGHVLQAEYHLNRNFAIGADVTLNDFYLFLGIDKIDGGDEIGWSSSDGYCWIDFANVPSELDDGSKYYIIDMVFPPEGLEYY